MIKVALIDLDGTVYEGNKVIDGAIEAINNLRKHGIKVIFCTNNSSLPPEKIVKKLNTMGITCGDDEVLSSIGMMVTYLKNHDMKKVYVCGSDEVIDYCRSNKIDLCDENKCENLVIAMDVNYNYEKMTKAVRAALRVDNILVCNQDALFPTEGGLCPGCGAIVSSILSVTKKDPTVIVGKPHTMMIDHIAKKFDLRPDDIIVIGDGEESDIKMAENYGSRSIQIGTDVRTIRDLIEWDDLH